MLIFVPIPPFSTPLSPFIIVSNIPNYRLPQNYDLGPPKLAPNPPKIGKITIFLKLKGLECSFLFVSPISTPMSPFIIVSNILNHRLPQNWIIGASKLGPNPPQMGKITIFPKLEGLECLFLFLSLHFTLH